MSRPERVDLRPAAELRARRAWDGEAGAGLLAASVLYGAASDLRNYLYEVGILAPRRAPIPVVSVGGLSVGGSGKTPLAAELARWLAGEGRRAAVVTHGFPDEMAVHRALNPELPVVGGADRIAAVARAASGGAGVAVVDSGFQHRRLAREYEVVALGSRDLRGGGRRLPAGPLRERWSALGRADAVVLVRRPDDPAAFPDVEGWLRRHLPDVLRARCLLEPGDLEPVNEAARAASRAAPAVAVASVMHPAPFFRSLERWNGVAERRYVLSDHRAPDADTIARVEEDAGSRGVVGTRKDAVKLAGLLDDDVPLWCLEERPRWEAGRGALASAITRTLDEVR